MRLTILLPVLFLAACSKPADTSAPASVQAPAPAITDTWPGKYEGDVMVRIDGNATSGHRVMLIEGQADGCTGDIGMADGGVLATAAGPDELDVSLNPDGIAMCTVKIKRAGDTLTVNESETCGAYHGATCSFNGTAKRVK